SKELGFVHYSTSQNINGVVVPIGTYLRDAHIANGTITNAKIANAAITTAKIDNLAVTSAKIEDLAVTTGKIANLAVDTLQINDFAVTIPRIQFTAGSETERVAGVDKEINRITIDTPKGAVDISFGFERLVAYDFGNPVTIVISIRRNGEVIREFKFGTSGGQVDHRWITVPTYVDKPTSEV